MSRERLLSEDEILSALRGLDRPTAPRPEFAARLYAVLRRESHGRGKAVPTLLAAALLATGVLGAAVVASQLNNDEDEDRPAVVVVPSATPSPLATASSTFASPEPPHTAPATPTLRPTPVVSAMQPVWRDDDDDDGFCTMNDVAVVEDGLVAVGRCGRRFQESFGYAVAWHSETGFEWRRVFEVAEEGSALRAVSGDGDGEGAVLLGDFQLFRGDQSAGFVGEQLPNPQRRGSPLLIDIARVGQNLFVLGETYVDGVGRPAAWITLSSEGAWQLIDVRPDLANIAPQLFSVVADENAFVIAGANPLAPVLLRYDLRSEWGAPDLIPMLRPCTDCVGDVTALVDSEAVVVDDSMWWKVGDEWHVHAIGEQAHKIDAGYAALRLEDGFIVTGMRSRSYPQDVVATSTDGAVWVVTLLNPDAGRRTEPSIRAMVEFNGRVIAVGDAVYVGPAKVNDYSP
jgi:hypothetical protein